MNRFKIITLILFIQVYWILTSFVLGQNLYDLLQFHPKTWQPYQKPLEYFYDATELRLNTAHDTLDIFILGHKKMSYRWHDVQRQREFNGWFGFEKDIEALLEKIQFLGLDFERQNYHIIYSPESDGIKTILRPEARFDKIGEQILPTFRHQITLTYYSYLMEVDFFLGEIDELEVLKSAGINDLVLAAAIKNNWYTTYKKKNLNKIMTINEDGSISVDTFVSRENPYYPRTNLDLGSGYVFGNSISFMAQPRFNIRIRTKKTNITNEMLFFTFTGYLSHLSQNDLSFQVAQDYYLGVGWESDQLGNNVSGVFGYRLFGNNGLFENNPAMFKVDYSILPKLKVFHSIFFNFSGDSRSANLIGISFLIY
ncbi:hypothetical protein MMU07_11270 [Aquiflexum sp. LQ15W]|uniref:hypothetical protein n=1 Tax=Cognataquiflexum nitidum TaxID=2922272 RepID=UPI001F145494|nr:hypothetical protein [Cognataquiflexum nitidum]MCH6200166.1 hypothetical protein [Cognataquiflexum nitidum]